MLAIEERSDVENLLREDNWDKAKQSDEGSNPGLVEQHQAKSTT